MKKHTERNLLTLFSVCCAAFVVVFTTCVLMNEQQSEAKTGSSAAVAEAPYDYRSSINPADVTPVVSIVDLAVDTTNPVVMSDLSSNIAVVRISAVDGASNYSELSESYVSPYTYGRMVVLDNLKGELPLGSELEFYRLGGTITKAQEYDALTAEQKAAYDNLHSSDSNYRSEQEWVKHYTDGDIDIAAGKTYLVYLTPETAYSGRPNSYAIIGYADGLRELSPEASGDNYSFTAARILNNHTNNWENLRDLDL